MRAHTVCRYKTGAHGCRRPRLVRDRRRRAVMTTRAVTTPRAVTMVATSSSSASASRARAVVVRRRDALEIMTSLAVGLGVCGDARARPMARARASGVVRRDGGAIDYYCNAEAPCCSHPLQPWLETVKGSAVKLEQGASARWSLPKQL